MENLIITSVWSGQGGRWLLPLFFALICYQAFKWFDSVISSEFRTKCASFILGKKYESYLIILPDIAAQIIDRIFGSKHFSIKCFFRSLLFSTLSLILTFIVSILYDSNKISYFIRFNSNLKIKYGFIVVLVWLLFCVIPDYIMLGKTRGIIWILRRIKLGEVRLIFIGMVDFFIISLTFMLLFVATQVIFLNIYSFGTGKLPNESIISIVRASYFEVAIFFLVEEIVFMATGVLYHTFPIANIFWSAVMPSFWLWIFIVSSITSRFLFSIKPVFGVLIHVLDVKNYPFRSLGIIASIITATTTLVVIVI